MFLGSFLLKPHAENPPVPIFLWTLLYTMFDTHETRNQKQMESTNCYAETISTLSIFVVSGLRWTVDLHWSPIGLPLVSLVFFWSAIGYTPSVILH